ncbi:MAG: hypothetical protein JO289_25060 [Xanthobacteraceae bacterium]|nr:hypothetical protein [Xanthobacteraceae bacterium]
MPVAFFRNRRITRVILIVFAAIVVIFTALVFGLSDSVIARFLLKPDRIIVERRPDPAYDKLFPYYVELCATSQFRPKLKGDGGIAGHAVMYIKGACKDEHASFPQLRRCHGAATDIYDPEHGAGVSVGRWFRNVNWVAVPGYKLFFEGNVNADEPLTQAHFDATLQEVVDKDVYKGVDFHDYPNQRDGGSLKDFVSQHGIGTDLALTFARSAFCARLPITEKMLDEVIDFLNDKNREYAEGEADYNWSVWADNCVHTLRNALAAANIWSPLSVRAVKFRQIFNLAVPANEFVNLAVLGNTGDITDYRQIQDDGPRRDALHEFNWLPTRQGALVKTLPVHAPNDLYDTTFRLFTLQSPFRMGKTEQAVDLLSDPRFVNLDANLRYFSKKYDDILAAHDEHRDRLASVRGTPYRRVERLYYDYIKAQRAEVASMLERLPELESSPGAARAEQTNMHKAN